MSVIRTKSVASRPIQIDVSSVSSASPEVQQRMQRIDENYQRLDAILSDVEQKIRLDARLSAIDESITEIEVVVEGRKRKWRARTATARKSTRSARPNKPR